MMKGLLLVELRTLASLRNVIKHNAIISCLLEHSVLSDRISVWYEYPNIHVGRLGQYVQFYHSQNTPSESHSS